MKIVTITTSGNGEVCRMSDELNNELKPCPFCGGKAELIERIYGAYKDVTVACKQCGIRSTLFSNDLEAITFWNRRASDDQK